MTKVLGIAQSALELAGFGVLTYWAWTQHPSLALRLAVYTSLALSAFGLVLRLRERSLAQEIADAEEKLVKRAVRRSTNHVLSELCNGLLSRVVAEHTAKVQGVLPDAVRAEFGKVRDEMAQALANSEQVQRVVRTYAGDAAARLLDGDALKEAIRREVEAALPRLLDRLAKEHG